MLTSYYVFNHIPSLLSSPPLPHRLLVYCGLGKAVQTSGEREEEEVNNVSLTLSALSMSWLPSVVGRKMIRFVEVGNNSAKKKAWALFLMTLKSQIHFGIKACVRYELE